MWTPFKSKFRCNVTVQVGLAATAIQECIYSYRDSSQCHKFGRGSSGACDRAGSLVWLPFSSGTTCDTYTVMMHLEGPLYFVPVFTLGTWSEARSITWWWDSTYRYLFHKFCTGSMTPHDGHHWDTWNTACTSSPHSVYHLLSSPWSSQTFTNLPYRFFSWNYDLPQLRRISVSLFPI